MRKPEMVKKYKNTIYRGGRRHPHYCTLPTIPILRPILLLKKPLKMG